MPEKLSKRRLYGDAAEIEKLISQMQLMETAPGGWATVYLDKNTGAFWLNCYATSGSQGGGYQLLIKLPLPSTEELVNLALTSEYEDEAVAAVLRLLDEETLEGKDFRALLIEKLEQLLTGAVSVKGKKRFTTVIKLAGLDDPMNRRNVLGKSKEEVQQDAYYFYQTAERAKEILMSLTN